MSAALRVEIGKYNPVKYLKLVSGLMSLRESRPEEFNREIEREGRDPREILRGYQIRHLIRELLQSNAPWDSGPAPHSRDIVMHCEWAQNSLCQADRGVLYHFMLTRPHSVPEDFALYVRSNSTR